MQYKHCHGSWPVLEQAASFSVQVHISAEKNRLTFESCNTIYSAFRNSRTFLNCDYGRLVVYFLQNFKSRSELQVWNVIIASVFENPTFGWSTGNELLKTQTFKNQLAIWYQKGKYPPSSGSAKSKSNYDNLILQNG